MILFKKFVLLHDYLDCIMEISKIRTLVSRAGEMQGIFVVDLVYLDGIPYAVFEWEKKEGADPVPLYKVRLDPRGLMPLPPGGDSNLQYQYRVSVEDPETVFLTGHSRPDLTDVFNFQLSESHDSALF